MRFASLGSGSRGNATLVEAAGTCLLVDCGYSMREFEARCQGLGVDPGAIDALLVTHEHGDHVRGVGPLARKYGLPVWMTHGTWRRARCGEIPNLHLFGAHAGAFTLGGVRVQPYAVPHDAREPCQFLFSAGGRRLGLLTDVGAITPRIRQCLQGLDALILECNHDPQMLRTGPYPPALQARVGGNYGHLSNGQAAQLLQSIDQARLQRLVLAHLSEKNNHPELAEAAVRPVWRGPDDGLAILGQGSWSGWFEVAGPA